jgi:hypothetical protein
MTDDARLSATNERKLTALCEALDVGIAELDAGLGVETTPEELIAEVWAQIEIEPPAR